jgi:hypothetical protein
MTGGNDGFKNKVSMEATYIASDIEVNGRRENSNKNPHPGTTRVPPWALRG